MEAGHASTGLRLLASPPAIGALVVAFGALGSVDVRAQVTTAPPAAAPPAEAPGDYAVATTLDHAGRVLAPVMVNGRGPFRFILDTGANRAVLSPRVVSLLQLDPASAGTIEVHGVTGTASLPAVRIERLQAGDLDLGRDLRMPVLSESVLADADGILGIEGLGEARIEIDFVRDTVRIERSSGRQRAGSGFLTIPASLRYGGLLTVPGRVGRVTVRAIIDTGAERSLGNEALRTALAMREQGRETDRNTTVFGATPDLGVGTSLVAPTIYLGEAELRNLEVTFGDLHVFRIWGLEDEPAILIGMDLLGAVDQLVIDYRRREVLLRPRGSEDRPNRFKLPGLSSAVRSVDDPRAAVGSSSRFRRRFDG